MNWDQWVPRWERAIAACERKGGDTVCLRVGPPASLREVNDVESALGRPLPRDFRDVLLTFSGEVQFFWFLPQGTSAPGKLSGVFCGECSWSVKSLSGINRELHSLVDSCSTAAPPIHSPWQHSIAFQVMACGDFLAIDATASTIDRQPVVYLNHEGGESDGYRLGPDFAGFIDVWTRLGCPSDDVFPLFIPARRGFLDPRSAPAKEWCAWFGLPDPEEED